MNPTLVHQPRVSRRPAVPEALPLPMSRAEMAARGWEEVDIVFVSGDAYVDHPSFAMAILARVLESAGYRVGMLSQPDWHSCEPWRTFGKPRLFFAISAGNMDSLINHYTANRKVRNDDADSPARRIGVVVAHLPVRRVVVDQRVHVPRADGEEQPRLAKRAPRLTTMPVGLAEHADAIAGRLQHARENG